LLFGCREVGRYEICARAADTDQIAAWLLAVADFKLPVFLF